MRESVISLLLFLMPIIIKAQDNVVHFKTTVNDLVIIKNNDTLPDKVRLLKNILPDIYYFEVIDPISGLRKNLKLKVEPFDSIVIHVDLDNDILFPSFYKNYKPGKYYDQKLQVFFIVDKMPVYPGGDEAMKDFIANEVARRSENIDNKVKGKVFVQFIINEEGIVSCVKVIRGLTENADLIAQQIFWDMPAWEPGYLRKKPVNISITEPVEFNK